MSRRIMQFIRELVTERIARIKYEPVKAIALVVGVPIVDQRALQIDHYKLSLELARRPRRRYQPQPDDSWGLAHG